MTGLRHGSDVQPKVPGDEALSMSDQKDDFHFVTDPTLALNRRIRERQEMQNNADEREIFYPDRAGRVVDRGIVAAARRPGKSWASMAEFVRKMKEDGASAAEILAAIETITRALLGDMG